MDSDVDVLIVSVFLVYEFMVLNKKKKVPDISL